MAVPEILYEDNHLIAVNKAAGALVQGDRTGDRTLPDEVKDYIAIKYHKPGKVYLGIIHRLDRPVSGLVLFGRTSKATVRMNDAFRTKEVRKTYWAIVEGEPPAQEGELKGYLSKNQQLNKSFLSEKKTAQGKFSELEYRWISSSDRYNFLEVIPHTGRHHQIRVMMSHMGCPIKGDLKYGARRSNKDGSICLHSRSLAFIHPVARTELFIEAPPPAQPIWQAFADTIS